MQIHTRNFVCHPPQSGVLRADILEELWLMGFHYSMKTHTNYFFTSLQKRNATLFIPSLEICVLTHK